MKMNRRTTVLRAWNSCALMLEMWKDLREFLVGVIVRLARWFEPQLTLSPTGNEPESSW